MVLIRTCKKVRTNYYCGYVSDFNKWRYQIDLYKKNVRMINMNVPTWIAWIIVAILAIISIASFTGKPPLFIAGYNTANQEEKNKYIINTLSKVTGGGLGVITGITALIVLYNGELPSAISWLVPWGILGTITLMFIIGITICKR
jgi:hypothetical protein